MDPKNAGEMLKHLEKQNELLEDAHKKMSNELHRLQGDVNKMIFNDAENEEPNAQADASNEQQ
ncbi:Potassium/sodium hyperpolarization-activated cyclic nucleotide-gated channel 4 [Bienertia sinuspersici]